MRGGLATTKLKNFQKKIRVGYVYIDTIFNMGYGGTYNAPSPMGYGSGKSPMGERVKVVITQITQQCQYM